MKTKMFGDQLICDNTQTLDLVFSAALLYQHLSKPLYIFSHLTHYKHLLLFIDM